MQQEWESLDKEIGRAMKIGEKALKKPSGRYAWSKTLRRAAYTRQYWKKRTTLHKYGIEETKTLNTIREIAGIKYEDMGKGASINKLEQWAEESIPNPKDIQRKLVNFRTTEMRAE